MRPFFLSLVTFTALISLSACGKDTPAPATPAPLARPVVTLKPAATGVQVPRALIAERNGLPGVFVVSTDHVARFRLVRLGEVRGGNVEIVSGLGGGETLVAGDLVALRDGSAITPNP